MFSNGLQKKKNVWKLESALLYQHDYSNYRNIASII